MRLSQMAKDVGGELLGADRVFSGICLDSRTVVPGQVYWAWTGGARDGHDYIDAAIAAGAVAVVASKPVSHAVPVIQVADTVKALGARSEACRARAKAQVMAITGSCGKTTVRQLLESITRLAGNTVASIKSYNNAIGVPLTMVGLDVSHDYYIQEIGTNQSGDIASLVSRVRPNIVAITNAGASHLAGLGTVQGVAQEKGAIITQSPRDAVVILNRDDEHCKLKVSLKAKSKT